MAKLSRKNDTTEANGKIVRGASTVFANGIAVGLHVSDITPHPGGGKHNASKTTEGSPSVFADGVAVLRVGSGTTCGHKVNQGSPDVFVP
jgi:uncharacterized Zn-binding protein involved in type VI secretion